MALGDPERLSQETRSMASCQRRNAANEQMRRVFESRAPSSVTGRRFAAAALRINGRCVYWPIVCGEVIRVKSREVRGVERL